MKNILGLSKKQIDYLASIDFINRYNSVYEYVHCEDIIAQLECTTRSYKILTTKLINRGFVERKIKNDRIEYIKFTEIGCKVFFSILEDLF
jgi:DNA-binding MarR family transcriptional regulator|nr:MAG TPA: multiple antibiotic resistance protein MarR/DNA family protein, HTH motif.67A [Caudoviricetes sp.]